MVPSYPKEENSVVGVVNNPYGQV